MNKKLNTLFISLAIAMSMTACSSNTAKTIKTTPITLHKAAKVSAKAWFDAGAATVEAASKRTITSKKGKAKNIILFVGDGMGISTVTAARILEGQLAGGTGEEHQISFEKLPFSGFSKTYNTNQQTPDSAGTMTAMMSGVKTKAGIIGLSGAAIRANCASSKGAEVVTALEMAENRGKATGIISTARITHATPAATYAHAPERNWESDDQLPAEAKANGCKDIALQFINFSYGDGIDVAMGGGRRHFLPKSVTDVEGKKGKRTDNRNLIAEWKAKHLGGDYIETQREFDAINPATTSRLLALFNSSHMRYEADRKNDVGGEPSLAEMTAKAIDILSKNNKGFFLMVEAGRIDHGHHAGSAYNALTDTIALASAVKIALEKTSSDDTLIITTADHSHVFTMGGYPTRGNPILGKVVGNDKSGTAKTTHELAKDKLPYTSLSYANGRGFADFGNEADADVRYHHPIVAGVRTDLSNVKTTHAGFHQETLVPLGAETHGGEDVGIYASGPGAHLLTGVIEQNVIFHVMNRMGGLGKQ